MPLPPPQLHGRVLTESMDIMLAIEAAFPSHNPLLPPATDAAASRHVQQRLRLERRVFGAWLQWGTQGEGGGSWGGGGGGPQGFEAAMDDVNAALQAKGGPYFLGEKVRGGGVSKVTAGWRREGAEEGKVAGEQKVRM